VAALPPCHSCTGHGDGWRHATRESGCWIGLRSGLGEGEAVVDKTGDYVPMPLLFSISVKLSRIKFFNIYLDDTSPTGVQRFQIFDAKFLQYWFFHVQSSIQIVSRGRSPFLSKGLITWQLVQ